MPDKAQPTAFGKIPDFEIADFRKRLLDIYENDAPDEAEKRAQMVALVEAGVAPDTAAPAAGIFIEWEEDEWFREAVDAAWARAKARVMMNVHNNLTGTGMNASLANLFLKAHCGFNEKSAEGWHQNIKILPIVSPPAGIHHNPNKDYADFYFKRQEEAERQAADAINRHESARTEPEYDDSGEESG